MYAYSCNQASNHSNYITSHLRRRSNKVIEKVLGGMQYTREFLNINLFKLIKAIETFTIL